MDAVTWIAVITFVVGVGAGLLFLGWVAITVLENRWATQRTKALARALISAVQATSDPVARSKQLRSHYTNAPKPSGTVELPVFLEKLVFERDSLGSEGFRKRYGIEVSDNLRNALHAAAEDLDAQQIAAEEEASGANDAHSDSDINHADRGDRPSEKPLSEVAEESVRADEQQEERRHRQMVQLAWLSIGVTVAVAIAGIIFAD